VRCAGNDPRKCTVDTITTFYRMPLTFAERLSVLSGETVGRSYEAMRYDARSKKERDGEGERGRGGRGGN
jgi:hypothetical protein